MTSPTPFDLGPAHIVGIGGIGMSGIAEILHNQGYVVQGSDLTLNPNVQRLRDMGITVEIGQSGDNLGKAEVVVVSSAIKKDNPELMAARARALPRRRARQLKKQWSLESVTRSPHPHRANSVGSLGGGGWGRVSGASRIRAPGGVSVRARARLSRTALGTRTVMFTRSVAG